MLIISPKYIEKWILNLQAPTLQCTQRSAEMIQQFKGRKSARVKVNNQEKFLQNITKGPREKSSWKKKFKTITYISSRNQNYWCCSRQDFSTLSNSNLTLLTTRVFFFFLFIQIKATEKAVYSRWLLILLKYSSILCLCSSF